MSTIFCRGRARVSLAALGAAANKDDPELIAVMAPSRTLCLLRQVPLVHLQENIDGRNA